MCSLFLNNCIYFVDLLLFNVNLCSGMYYPKIPRTGTKYLIDFKDLNQVCPLYLFMYFLMIVQKKKMCIFALISFHFFGQYRNFLYAIKWKQRLSKSLALTFATNEFPIAQQRLPFFRTESLQFTSFPA